VPRAPPPHVASRCCASVCRRTVACAGTTRCRAPRGRYGRRLAAPAASATSPSLAPADVAELARCLGGDPLPRRADGWAADRRLPPRARPPRPRARDDRRRRRRTAAWRSEPRARGRLVARRCVGKAHCIANCSCATARASMRAVLRRPAVWRDRARRVAKACCVAKARRLRSPPCYVVLVRTARRHIYSRSCDRRTWACVLRPQASVPDSLSDCLAGLLAGACAAALTTPLDVLVTHAATSRPEADGARPRGPMQIGAELVRARPLALTLTLTLTHTSILTLTLTLTLTHQPSA
jgi:hypothetical protein